MKKIKDIDKNIEATLNVLEDINKANVSPFFKDKTMQLLFAEKEELSTIGFSWFTPKIQFATLICIVIINIFGIMQLTKTTYNENVSEFANTYELSQEGQSSLFN